MLNGIKKKTMNKQNEIYNKDRETIKKSFKQKEWI